MTVDVISFLRPVIFRKPSCSQLPDGRLGRTRRIGEGLFARRIVVPSSGETVLPADQDRGSRRRSYPDAGQGMPQTGARLVPVRPVTVERRSFRSARNLENG